MWNVVFCYIEEWLAELDQETKDCITAAVEILAEEGPTLGRPLVDTIAHARHANLKELRPPSPGFAEFRILFAFDSKRNIVLLVGGDKSGESVGKGKNKWSAWYRKNVPLADNLLDEHEKRLKGQMNNDR